MIGVEIKTSNALQKGVQTLVIHYLGNAGLLRTRFIE
jgi:hypothetical protein